MNIQPWHWLVLGALLLIGEMLAPTFWLLWFGAAALVLALLTWIIPMSLAVQVILWLILSTIALIAWFKFIQPMAKDKTRAGLGGAAIIGEVGMIIRAPIDGERGRIRFSVPQLGSDEWTCRSSDELSVGDRAKIIDISGNELVVSKV